jgi:hypothetical protein
MSKSTLNTPIVHITLHCILGISVYVSAICRGSYLTVQFLVHQLAVNTCQNVLVKYDLLTDAMFIKTLERSLTMSNS